MEAAQNGSERLENGFKDDGGQIKTSNKGNSGSVE